MDTEVITEITKKVVVVPASAEARAFYAALQRGEPFTLRRANWCGVTRRAFEKIKREFLIRGAIVWRDGQHHERGLMLTEAGRAIIAELAKGESL
jgi:hypothetical protein